MRKSLLLLALVAMLALPPLASAAHGQAYTARGIAMLCSAPVSTPTLPGQLQGIRVDCEGAPENEVFTAEVYWSGYWERTFTVTIESATEAVVDGALFPGLETWQGPVAFQTEFFAYRGWSLDPAHDFEITGLQIIQIQTGFLTMVYTGHYGPYSLVLFV